MSAVLTDSFRVNSATLMLNALVANPSYVFIGKSSPWPNDIPQTPLDNKVESSTALNDMIFGKKIAAGNLSLCIDRYNWATGTVYDIYDVNDANMFSGGKKFYVLTADNNVYKCLGNNRGGPSTVRPTGRALTPFSTADGYIWKFMLTVTADKADTFMNSQYIPVTNDPEVTDYQYGVKAAALPGAIESYTILASGNGYTSAQAVITGDGTGASALVVLSGGSVSDILVVNAGSNYTWAKVEITGNGAGAIAEPQPGPVLGHGSNAPVELGARYLMAAMEYGGEESDRLAQVFSFRRLGLVMNPLTYNTTTPFTSLLLIGTYKIYVNTLTGFDSGSKVNFSNGSGLIVTTGSDGGGSFMLISECPRLSVGSVALASNAGVSATITSVVPPDLRPNSGQVCYIENRNPIFKNDSQTELTRVIIEF